MGDFTQNELEKLAKERLETRLRIKKAYQIAYNNPFRQQVISDPAGNVFIQFNLSLPPPFVSFFTINSVLFYFDYKSISI
jgi:hypothetical protein